MKRRTGVRSGLSVIELLAVLTIIAVLISLMLPALTTSREAARRSQCLNNLKQIGLAFHNYESTYQVLPPGVVDTQRPIRNQADGLHIGWLVQLLPYLEQQALSNATDTRFSVYAPENLTVALTRINSLNCPSDPQSVPPDGRPWSSYAACHHDVEAPIDVDNHGVFFLNSRLRHDGISDGSSTTIFVGEKWNRDWDTGGWMSGTRSTLRNTGSPINAADDRHDPDIVGGYGSYHHAGANFGFGDGSVRFLHQGIFPEVYRHLGNRADGEPVDEDAL